MAYTVIDRVYSIFIDVMTGVSSGSGSATFYNTDSHTSYIELTVTNGNQEFDMTAYNYILVVSKPNKQTYKNKYTTIDKSKLVIALDSQMLAGSGSNMGQLFIMKTVDNVAKVLTMVEFNYIVKDGSYKELAPESTDHDALYIKLRNDVDSILSKIENGEIGGAGMTATQKEQLATAYNHAMSDAVTTTEVVNSTVAAYVEANKDALKGDKGDKGDRGETGAIGADGKDGAKGADGITPTIAVGTTTTGEAGTDAAVTMSSSGTTYTLDFTIPKGAKGEKGDTGAKGEKGDIGAKGEKGTDGITPTLSVGTVTTGEAGSSASVIMSGTAPDYVLNFAIPKGDKGDKGDTGASGSGSSSNGIAFQNEYVDDANKWLTNGYIKTSGSATANLPSVCTFTKDRWGVLFFIAENAANGTGTQMFFPIDGNYKGKIFTRSIVDGAASVPSIGAWSMLSVEDNLIELVTDNAGIVALSNRMYQKVNAAKDITINLPLMNIGTIYKEIHLFYWSSGTYTVTVAAENRSIYWESVPTLEANAITEFIFTWKGDNWICRGTNYKKQ